MRPGTQGEDAGPGPEPGDVVSKARRSAVMRQVRSKNTTPELTARRLLTRMGLRYRLHRKDLPGTPDLVFAGRRVALFVHGCFWHGHDCPRGARTPKANQDYWIRKIRRNRERDAAAQERLRLAGWRAAVVWECELRRPEGLEARLMELLGPPLGSDPPGSAAG